jgi:hypothetical protein
MGLFNWLFGKSKPEVFQLIEDTPPQAERKWRRPKGAVQVWAWCRANKVHGREIYCPHCSAHLARCITSLGPHSSAATARTAFPPRSKWYTVRTDKELKRQIAQAEAKAGGKK